MKPILILILCLCSAVCNAESMSTYWGAFGERWTGTSSRIYNFSYAGYDNGNSDIPKHLTYKNAKDDFGAVGNGVATDTTALNTAITNTTGKLFLPNGTYIMDNILAIDNKSNFILRGESQTGTIIKFNVDLEDLYGDSDNWRWGGGGMVWIGSSTITGGWPALGSLVANLTGTATRGTTTVAVSTPNAFTANTYYLFRKGHNADYSLIDEMHGEGLLSAGSLTAFGTGTMYWVGKVIGTSGSNIILENPFPSDFRMTWSDGIYNYNPRCTNIGIENLTIEFPDVPYLMEVGHKNVNSYNGIAIYDSQNCWVKNVIIKNPDNGMAIARLSCNNYIKDVIFDDRSFANRKYETTTAALVSGHHGISLLSQSHNNLVDGLTINSKFVHEITLDGKTTGNVIKNVSGVDIFLDHHSGGAHSNLFSNINVGSATKPWQSSGYNVFVDDVPNSGAWEVFWNIRTGTGSAISTLPKWGLISTNFPSGVDQVTPDSLQRTGEVANQIIFPTELHQWQLLRRRGFTLGGMTVQQP